MKKAKNLTKKLTESSLMIAFATVLSICKLAELPYGGSITLASMLPIVIIAYRHGIGMGLASGVTYALIQQLLGLNNLSYVTTWQSVLAVILLDYVIAFTVVGLGGIFKGKLGISSDMTAKKQGIEMGCGMAFVCILRYICHVISGATVWAGLSIPTEAALIYSIGYNATYMLPETIVSVLATVWIGELIDFSKELPVRIKSRAEASLGTSSLPLKLYPLLRPLAKLFIFVTVAVDSVLILSHIQNPEDGAFTFEYLAEVNWIAVIIVSAVGVALSAATFIFAKVIEKKRK